MKYLLFVLLLITSCTSVPKAPSNDPEPIPPNQTSSITLGKITGATKEETQTVATAIAYVQKVVASPEFIDQVTQAKFTNTNNLTNKQILDLFLSTKILVNVDIFTGSWIQNHVYHTEGYEQGDGFAHINRYFIKSALDMGSLILHEISHEPLNFKHKSAGESTSVPYTMNQIFYTVAKKLDLEKRGVK